ncbi:Metallo-dependent hydrolase [Athelia psychrophila]|uniref:Metallo-dependent hydrolase n=1 Tax=Athelia psychrophila TaxID=1759441 RepID=A0A166PGE7_9AGAM|nr:Metallo-dependent hydrolase [Fibularhizoctonia sp. CBS 109695]
MSNIRGFCEKALSSLTPNQVDFLQTLPKAELHAHLNGCIPIALLQDLARERAASDNPASDAVQQGIEQLLNGVELNEIGDFFGLFPAIYALTSTPEALGRAARAVLELFLRGPTPQCQYLELRSTPRATAAMTRREYVRVVLDEIDLFNTGGGEIQAALIVSMDRRMGKADLRECLDIAVDLRREGRRVVGVDLCGDPMAGDINDLREYFAEAKQAGLGVTLHIAETAANPSDETLDLLSFGPHRLGHATFLDPDAKSIVLKEKMCIEICLSSNLLCKTVTTLDEHHIGYYLKHGHPVAICTDDTLPFRNSLLGEYALLLAARPLGLGLSENEVETVAAGSWAGRFTV